MDREAANQLQDEMNLGWEVPAFLGQTNDTHNAWTGVRLMWCCPSPNVKVFPWSVRDSCRACDGVHTMQSLRIVTFFGPLPQPIITKTPISFKVVIKSASKF